MDSKSIFKTGKSRLIFTVKTVFILVALLLSINISAQDAPGQQNAINQNVVDRTIEQIRLYYGLGQYAQVIRQCRKLEEIDPGNKMAKYWRSRAEAKLEEKGMLEEVLQQTITPEPPRQAAPELTRKAAFPPETSSPDQTPAEPLPTLPGLAPPTETLEPEQDTGVPEPTRPSEETATETPDQAPVQAETTPSETAPPSTPSSSEESSPINMLIYIAGGAVGVLVLAVVVVLILLLRKKSPSTKPAQTEPSPEDMQMQAEPEDQDMTFEMPEEEPEVPEEEAEAPDSPSPGAPAFAEEEPEPAEAPEEPKAPEQAEAPEAPEAPDFQEEAEAPEIPELPPMGGEEEEEKKKEGSELPDIPSPSQFPTPEEPGEAGDAAAERLPPDLPTFEQETPKQEEEVPEVEDVNDLMFAIDEPEEPNKEPEEEGSAVDDLLSFNGDEEDLGLEEPVSEEEQFPISEESAEEEPVLPEAEARPDEIEMAPPDTGVDIGEEEKPAAGISIEEALGAGEDSGEEKVSEEEPEAEEEKAKSGQSGTEVDVNEFLFDSTAEDQAETRMASPADAGTEEEKEHNESFNKMMFDGESSQETIAAGIEPESEDQEIPAGDEDETMIAQPQKKVEPPEEEEEEKPVEAEGETDVRQFSVDSLSSVGDEQKESSPGKKKIEERNEALFSDQYKKGKEAFDNENWKKAVHYLTVASALKPDVKEIKDMLSRARREKRAADNQ
mgnify:CR=1 FL=1